MLMNNLEISTNMQYSLGFNDGKFKKSKRNKGLDTKYAKLI